MNIITTNHRFRTPFSPADKRKITDRVTIHHSAGNDVSAATIHEWHLSKKTKDGRPWRGIGYHFVVRMNGTIETGRPIDMYGAHAGASANGRSVGICVTGNMESSRPTIAQVHSLVWLIRDYIFPYYGKELIIDMHKNHMPTSCPGRFFPMEDIKQRIATQGVKLRINKRSADHVVLKMENNRIQIQVKDPKGLYVYVELKALADLLGAKLAWTPSTRTADLDFN